MSTALVVGGPLDGQLRASKGAWLHGMEWLDVPVSAMDDGYRGPHYREVVYRLQRWGVAVPAPVSPRVNSAAVVYNPADDIYDPLTRAAVYAWPVWVQGGDTEATTRLHAVTKLLFVLAGQWPTV